MDMADLVRRMRLRDQLSISEIAKRTGLSHNAIKKWLNTAGNKLPRYRRAKGAGKLSAFEASLELSFIATVQQPAQG
jgi:transcriptional regulator with XRE-family HTH domain